MLDRRFLAPHALAEWARATPSAVALEHVNGAKLTYEALYTDSLRWAAALQRAGVTAGTHCASLLPNDFPAHRTMLGLAWLQAIEVPLNIAYRGRMLEYALDRAEVTCLVTTYDGWSTVGEVAERLPKLQTVVLVDDATVDDPVCETIPIAELLADTEPATDLAGPDAGDIACILFTSGTTGPSKAVVCPWGLVYQMTSWMPDDTLAPGDGFFSALPLFHNSGRSGFNYALVHGARFVFRDKFSATNFWDDTRATNCTTAALVGPMTSVLFHAPARPDDHDNPLESVILGPMIPDMEEFERRFGVRVCTCYGQTEIGAPLASDWDHGPWESCGRVRTDYPFPEVRLVNEHDEPVAVGEVGELLVRVGDPTGFNADYFGMPDETAAAWRDGWFHTGDAFRVNDDGHFYFVDRMKDTIRRRGENISSFEVESMVLEHPHVVECAAVAIATEHGDDEVMAAVIVDDQDAFDPPELIEFLTPRMPRFMIPRYIEVFDDLPRNETTGRVRKTELRTRGVSERTWDREALAS
ncbi:MAG: ATP-dependent acyl-CoA ligase [Actinobacteria bacterium]|nr:MAG: ATP-dependent acyl-CoA ligase [Actinomycetota bacterium]